jgi:lipopolysaccharide export system protein LptC
MLAMSVTPDTQEASQSHLNPQRRLTRPIVYYTRFVYLIKRFLWLLAACVLAGVIYIASDNTGEHAQRIILSAIPHSDTLQPVMNKPHYQGLDKENEPYTVNATTATQKDANTVDMDTVTADMIKKGGRWLGLNSDKGELNTQTKQMLLNGHVTLFTDGGYEFRSDHAHVDIQQGNADGDSPVEGQGPPGTLTANSFTSDGKKHIITFNGSVRMILYH